MTILEFALSVFAVYAGISVLKNAFLLIQD